MKKASMIFIAILLALLIAGTLPAQVLADSLPEYISEVKIYEGNCDAAASEGFKILSDDNGDPVDLNQGSGSTAIGAKGNRKVYLGYKTTTVRSAAITDLALMNMKGGYDCAEYDKLMEGQICQQIAPFVDSFLAAIDEYRANYNSENASNKARAQYIHDMLNKLTDDDCGGAGLGDLFLNETVYELAKPQYDALSDTEKENTSISEVNNQARDSLPEGEKNKHADILTIIAQSNGNATLLMQNLLTRAADDNEDTWLDRFEGLTYADLLDSVDGAPSDKMAKLAKNYDDDAKLILEKWEDFRERLENYEKALEILNEANKKDTSQAEETFESFDFETSTQEEAEKAAEASIEIRYSAEELANAAADVFCKEYLETIDYEDGTLLDFFTQPVEDIEEDLTVLYPIVASLTKGQRAGLAFVSLQNLVMIGSTDEEGYQDATLDALETTSIYLGVDRDIYKKGGVALTSEALRGKVITEDTPEKSYALHIWSAVAVGLTLVGAGAFIGSWVVKSSVDKLITTYNTTYTSISNSITRNTNTVNTMKKKLTDLQDKGLTEMAKTQQDNINSYNQAIENAQDELKKYDPQYVQRLESQSSAYSYMRAGAAVFTVVMIAVSATLIYLDYKAMKDYYNVDFTPIPHYMVDEKDITVTNENGDKIVIKNQSAYYKAVESNRKKGDSYFNDIGACADMNGCVNPQWLALYAAKNEAMSPILASSLKVVVGSAAVPEGYETGIHMFGEKAAFNLNNKLYCWNQSAKSVMVYFKVDTAAASTAGTTGSSFTAGNLALAGGVGLVIGALASGIAVSSANKKKTKKAEA